MTSALVLLFQKIYNNTQSSLYFFTSYKGYLETQDSNANSEKHLALKIRLSVFDQREEPKVSPWGDWSGTPQADDWTEPCTVCGENQPKVRLYTKF